MTQPGFHFFVFVLCGGNIFCVLDECLLLLC